MTKKTVLFIIVLFISFSSFGQKYNIGDYLTPSRENFKLIGVSSKTNVHTYQYLGGFTQKHLYGREVGDIIVGVKNNEIVTIIYNLIPNMNDKQIPTDVVRLVQKTITFPLAYKNGVYGVNIDDKSISVSRVNNALTFNKDRIMILRSINQSILRQ